MVLDGVIVSAVHIPARKKDGVDKPSGVLAHICYGDDLQDGPEMAWLSPAEDHLDVLKAPKFAQVAVAGGLYQGRFRATGIKPRAA